MSLPPPDSDGPAFIRGIPPEHHGRGERILHVDDEHTVTVAVQRLLQKLGYHVHAFNDPRAALDRLRTAPGDFDLVLTDLMMPGIDGLAVAETSRALRPDLPVVLLSAYTGAHSSDAVRATGIREVILKPAGIATLAAALRRALDHPSASA